MRRLAEGGFRLAGMRKVGPRIGSLRGKPGNHFTTMNTPSPISST